MTMITNITLGLFIVTLLLAIFGVFQYSKLANYLKQKYPTEWAQEIHKNYWMTGRGGTGEWYRVLDSIKNHQNLKNNPSIQRQIKFIKAIRIITVLFLVLFIAVVIFYKK